MEPAPWPTRPPKYEETRRTVVKIAAPEHCNRCGPKSASCGPKRGIDSKATAVLEWSFKNVDYAGVTVR
jgi:hypothetical protein